jgi:DTW domain-containing protein YfiP
VEEPHLHLRTHLVLVQHASEIGKPTNTGRLAVRMLANTTLAHWGQRDRAFDPAVLHVPGHRSILLFHRRPGPVTAPGVGDRGAHGALRMAPPGADDDRGHDDGADDLVDEARDPLPPVLSLEELRAPLCSPDTPPFAMVVLDGTWAQCARMSRKNPVLRRMPTFSVPPGPPSHWGVREELDDARLSTLEAIIRAVALLEGPTPARAMQHYFDRVAARMLHMKGKQRTTDVPQAWIDEANARFGALPEVS